MLHPQHSLYGDINACFLFALPNAGFNKTLGGVNSSPRDPPASISLLDDEILFGDGIAADDHGDAEGSLKAETLLHFILIKVYRK